MWKHVSSFFCFFAEQKSFQSVIALTKILWKSCFYVFSCFILSFSCFLIRFVTMGWFSKRWVNLQTRVKLSSPQNTPNTVPKRPSKLIISVMFDHFYGFNQTFWCSIVGVFLVETHTNFKFPDLFSNGFCIARLLYFPKIFDFRDELYSVI